MSAMSDTERRLAAVLRTADHCHGLVTRDGIEDACGKPPVAVIDDPDGGPWPTCAYHAHRYGGGRVVPLAQLLAAERERVATAIAGSVRYGFELRPDGTEDPTAAAYVEGLRDAWVIARTAEVTNA